MNTHFETIVRDGLWINNPGLVQLLGLCPLLAVTSTVVNGLGLGLATLLTLIVSNCSVSLARRWIQPEVRLPVFVIIIACTVTAIELIMNAYFHELHGILGIFIPLIVTNCAILARAEAFASKNNVIDAFMDAVMMGLGFLLVLVALGGMRELLGNGTLFSNAQLMFGEGAKDWIVTLSSNYPGFLLAILPPGAFIGLGVLIALKNWIDSRLSSPAPARLPAIPVTNS